MSKFIDGEVHKGKSFANLEDLGLFEAMKLARGVRNTLTTCGLGCADLGVHNLDCVYWCFIIDAVAQEAMDRGVIERQVPAPIVSVDYGKVEKRVLAQALIRRVSKHQVQIRPGLTLLDISTDQMVEYMLEVLDGETT